MAKAVILGLVNEGGSDGVVLGGFPGIVHRAAVFAKVTFGLLDDTEANRRLLSDEIRKWMMVEVKMRPAHVAQYWPMAVELALLPGEAELMARRVRKSRLGRKLRTGGSPK